MSSHSLWNCIHIFRWNLFGTFWFIWLLFGTIWVCLCMFSCHLPSFACIWCLVVLFVLGGTVLAWCSIHLEPIHPTSFVHTCQKSIGILYHYLYIVSLGRDSVFLVSPARNAALVNPLNLVVNPILRILFNPSQSSIQFLEMFDKFGSLFRLSFHCPSTH